MMTISSSGTAHGDNCPTGCTCVCENCGHQVSQKKVLIVGGGSSSIEAALGEVRNLDLQFVSIDLFKEAYPIKADIMSNLWSRVVKTHFELFCIVSKKVINWIIPKYFRAERRRINRQSYFKRMINFSSRDLALCSWLVIIFVLKG